MAIALGTVLSTSNCSIFLPAAPLLAVHPVICLPGYWFGLGAGIATGVAYDCHYSCS